MSAPSESATSSSACACTNISLMQLFHELKQKFPGVPDHVVSNTIELYCHDKQACETHLHSEVKASLTHAYHASSSAAARQLNELKINAPGKCRNQPIVKHEASKSTAIKSIICPGPQTAVLSSSTETIENEKNILNTDANQNVVLPKSDKNHKNNNDVSSPVINIDNCYANYNQESPSDLELTNENVKEETLNLPQLQPSSLENLENTNYRILKSNKIKSNLPERLEKGQEKKTIKKEDSQQKQVPREKPQRPKTLDFIKPNPDIAFKQTSKESEPDTCQTVSPAPSAQKNDHQHIKETVPSKSPYRPERGYPLNLSVNVNCHMDLSRAYGDPWLENYDSPRAITSVNLTVCTPTSNMASPVRESREEDGAFEGHVTVTVSPSTARAPRRPAPPPPPQPSRLESQRPSRTAPEPPETANERSLIERQKERLARLARAMAQERGRLTQLTKETQILAAPPPSPAATQRLREYVEQLRDQCDTLAKRLEMGGGERDESANFYSNIYTGQRPPPSWQCDMCTFRNHPLLDKCEQCDMPRIFVGTSLTRTHDSGFGSFRDRTRTGAQHVADTTDLTDSGCVTGTNIVQGHQSLPKLNC